MSVRSYKEIAWPFFRNAFIAIDKVFREMNIFYYLIGAQARDIHLLDQGIAPVRGTQDIDFAVMLPDMDQYENLMAGLEKNGFERVREPYRMIYRQDNIVVDLLPFGEIEEMATVRFTQRDVELSVLGLKEVSGFVQDYKMDNIVIRVSPLEGISILKLLSWRDRHERTKDLYDFGLILKNYFDINTDRFYEECRKDNIDLNDISTEEFMLEAGALLLGRDMGKLLKGAPELAKDLMDILSTEPDAEPHKISAYLANNGFIRDYSSLQRIFGLIQKGFRQTSQ